MNTKELRIGNHVIMSGVELHMDVKLFHAVIHGFKGYEPKPIPMSTNWLRKFKFKELNEGHWHIGTRPFFVKEIEEGVFVLVLHLDEKGMKFVRLNAVHELQNLYQALTKEEL